jgi:hypothetical protein
MHRQLANTHASALPSCTLRRRLLQVSTIYPTALLGPFVNDESLRQLWANLRPALAPALVSVALAAVFTAGAARIAPRLGLRRGADVVRARSPVHPLVAAARP